MCYLCATLTPVVKSLVGGTVEYARCRIRRYDTLDISLYSGNAHPVTPIVSSLKETLIPTQEEMIGIGGIG